MDFTAIACLPAVANIPNVAGMLAVAEASNADVPVIVVCPSVLNVPVVAGVFAVSSVSAVSSMPCCF